LIITIPAGEIMEWLTKYKLYRFFLGVAALVIGFTSQYLLTSNRPLIAAFLFALAVTLIILALRKQPGPMVEMSGFQPVESGKKLRWGYAAGVLAVILAILEFGLFASSIPSIYPWLFYLASVALLIASIALVDVRKQPDTPKAQHWSWLEIGFFAAIFAIAAFMRLYRFNQVPFGTWYDEADNGLNALRILNEPGFLPVFAESTNLPAHFIYLIALSFRLLGVSTLSIRAVSVVFGLGTVAAAYLSGRELFNRKMGLVIAFILAVSRWDVNWSRIGMHGVTVPFFELLTIGLVLRALRRQRLMDYALAGLSIGLSLGFYTPLRLFPLVVGLFIVALWNNRHNLIQSIWRGLLVLFLGGIIAATPILYLTIFKPDEFFSRMETVSIFAGKTPQEGWQAVAKTTAQHLLMFNYRGDSNGRHNLPGQPMLDPIMGTLMVLGAGLCLWRIRQPGYFLLLAWLLLMLAPGIFSLDFEAPQSLRAIGSLPAAYLLAAVPINGLWQEWEKSSKKRLNYLFFVPLMLVLGISGYINYDIYFNKQAKSPDSWTAFSTPETIAAKIMAKMGNTVEYYVSTYYYQVPTIQFLAPAVTDYHRWETYDALPVASDGKKGIVFLVDGTQDKFFQQAKRYYPSATFEEFTAPNGVPVLYEIYLHPSDILASQGLTASYYHGTEWSGQPFLVRTEKNLDFNFQDGDPAPFPFSVEWKGVLLASTYGDYQIFTRSPAPMELTIDDVPIVFQNNGDQKTAEISLAKGDHAITIRTEGMAGHYELDWQLPSENEAPIPASAFQLPPITNNGLLGKFYANAQWSGEPAFTEVDPWVDVYFQVTPLNRPYTVEWTGNIHVPSSGHYLFGLECRDSSTLWIDSKQVLDDQTPDQYQEAGIDLAAGLHSLRIRYTDQTGYTHIHLYWTPPGSEREIIPQEILFPPSGDPGLINVH
jgi:4-amino-4-deoxy-L-arabinose transferase-like glycosyltransferase